MDYSKQLKKLIKSKNLNQTEVAKMVGVTQQTISGWVTRRYPSLEHIETLCNLLGIKLWEFFVPKEDIAKYFKLSPEAYTAAQAIDLLPKEQKSAALIMIAGYLSAVGKK